MSSPTPAAGLAHEDEATHSHPRTEAALQRLRQAMAQIEAEIEAHGGSYPYNHGRMTQSELCRRADVKKATLQNPVHKDSTRVEVMNWCDAINARLAQTRDAARLQLAASADGSSAEPQGLLDQLANLQQRLDAAESLVEQLQAQNRQLRGQLGLD